MNNMGDKVKELLNSEEFTIFKWWRLRNLRLVVQVRIGYYVLYILKLERAIAVYQEGLQQIKEELMWDRNLEEIIQQINEDALSILYEDIDKIKK